MAQTGERHVAYGDVGMYASIGPMKHRTHSQVGLVDSEAAFDQPWIAVPRTRFVDREVRHG